MNDIENFKCYKGILGPQLLIQEIFIEHILHLRYCDRNEDKMMSKTAFFPHTAQSLVWGLQKVSREVKYNVITACMLRNFSRVPFFFLQPHEQ